MISIILATYNSELYIADAIDSVLNQSYQNFEVLVVNDGSTDGTEEIVKGYQDPRIRYFYQKNSGVSSARNLAFANMKGDYFCFLDADDVLPENALKSRMYVLQQNDSVDFVDGAVEYVDEKLSKLDKHYLPNFEGDPLPLLLRLDRRCLFGNTWMVRRRPGITYRFDESLTHAEDLYFYLSICNQYKATYSFTKEPVLLYRQSSGSAMKNLKGLEEGYWKLLNNIKRNISHTDKQLRYLKYRIIRIMILSYLIDGRDPISAVKIFPKFMRV